MSYYDINYAIQDAVATYLSTNKATYSSGIAAALPVIKSGDFEDRSRDHIFVHCQTASGDQHNMGMMKCRLNVGVATVRETTTATHRNYCKAIFDLLMDSGFAGYVTNTTLAVIQRLPQVEFQTSTLTDSMRAAMAELTITVVYKPIVPPVT
jgi:hypothetical protein